MIRGFRTAEDGSLTIFGLFIFFIMMLAGGIALDIMRSEAERTELQYAVDRAVLAAAGLDQERESEAVVRDYLRAAGLDEDSVTVTATNTGSDRRVKVESDSKTASLFLDALGVDELVQPISTEAREVRTRLELSLVVDISGSMGGAKIERLRTAAKDFVAELLEGREELTTISLVPYNDRVNVGSVLGNVFDLTDEHHLSNCVVFDDASFNRLHLDPGEQLQRMGDFDFRTSRNSGNRTGLTRNPNCLRNEYGAILPWSNDVDVLHTHIDGLGAGNWTAVDLGVKWGTLLLDPSSQDELSVFANSPDIPAAQRVDASFVGRPVDYGTEGTHKVLVVMTDGENTQQWDLKDGDGVYRKSGPSAIYVFREPRGANSNGWATGTLPRQTGVTSNRFWKSSKYCSDESEGYAYSECRAQFDDTGNGAYRIRYSVWSPRVGKYWIDHINKWRDHPYGGNNAVRLDWADVYSSLSMRYIRYYIVDGSGWWPSWLDYSKGWEQTHNRTSADRNLSNICAEARANDKIVIYTIAFQAPPAGQAAMRDCAGPDHAARYFDITSLNIESAFDDILASVSRLRLIQ
nr:pilus assembly protein TadG-related protein [Jannaschia sp. S6380]